MRAGSSDFVSATGRSIFCGRRRATGYGVRSCWIIRALLSKASRIQKRNERCSEKILLDSDSSGFGKGFFLLLAVATDVIICSVF